MPEPKEPKPKTERETPSPRDDRKVREAARYGDEIPTGTFRIPRV